MWVIGLHLLTGSPYFAESVVPKTNGFQRKKTKAMVQDSVVFILDWLSYPQNSHLAATYLFFTNSWSLLKKKKNLPKISPEFLETGDVERERNGMHSRSNI